MMNSGLVEGGSDIVRPPHWALVPRYLQLIASGWGQILVATQNAVSAATATFWAARNVPTLHLPVTTGSVSSPMGLGSDSLPVHVNIDGTDVYLADSMQFLLEFGCRLTPNGCYYLMPSFRGEAPDHTHLSQFFHSEAEIPGCLDVVMDVVEQYVRALSGHLLDTCADHIMAAAGTVRHLEQLLIDGTVFERITFDAAAHILASTNGVRRRETIDGRGYRILTRGGERALLAHFGRPVWVCEYDHLGVPFYQAFAAPDMSKATNADLLFGCGEIVGAGERHSDAQGVRRALRLHGVDEAPYNWYITMREHHPIRTAGFGMGIERFLMWVLHKDDIRDLQLLVRGPDSDCCP